MLNLNFFPFPILTTDRLTLRQLRIKDCNEIFVLRSDERVNKYLERPPTISIEDARKFIEKINQGILNNDWVYWAISFKKHRKLIGTICYWNISKEKDTAEIGYELHPDFQGKGIMQEAISKVIEFGFEKMRLQTITACLTSNNYKSIKLLEKNNFHLAPDLEYEKDGNDKITNSVVYSLGFHSR